MQVDDVPFDSVPDVIGNYHLCVVKSMRLNSELISRAKRMKLIMQYGVGLEGVLLHLHEACELSCLCQSSPDAMSHSVVFFFGSIKVLTSVLHPSMG